MNYCNMKPAFKIGWKFNYANSQEYYIIEILFITLVNITSIFIFTVIQFHNEVKYKRVTKYLQSGQNK